MTWRTINGIRNEDIYHQLQLLSLHGQSKDARHRILMQYHKSCARCDAISTNEADLFASGEMLGHSYNDNGFCERCDAYVSAYGFTGNKGNYYYVDLAAGFGVTVADCVIGDYTLKYQPVCYVRAVLESEAAPENLKQLVTALYLYYRMSQMS